MGHLHHGGLALDDEHTLIRTTQETLARETSMPISGWLSPDRSQSSNTLTLLAEAGFRYVTDWANDDMPYMVATKAGQLCALPLSHELSDRLLLVQNNMDVGEYVDQVLRAFARLNAESDRFESGRILSLSITPWILGYPHRIGALERLLGRLLESGLVWNANGMEIVDTFKAQSTGIA
jgi:peptidoglycan/xylan/chitin deacetylase (PgdA/CDA1 family)